MLLISAVVFADMPPQSVVMESGNLKVRLDGRKFWNINRIVWEEQVVGVDQSGAHYGVAYQPGGSKFFIGSGHDESGKSEKLNAIRFFIDDGQEMPVKSSVIRAAVVGMEKESQIADFNVKYRFFIDHNILHERVEISAKNDVKVNFLYPFMHPWSTRFTDYYGIGENGSTVSLKFKSDGSFPNRNYLDCGVWYDEKSGIGVASLITPESGEKSLSRFLWDRQNYRKDYLCDYSHAVFPAGHTAIYTSHTAFFRQPDKTKWRQDAIAILNDLKFLHKTADSNNFKKIYKSVTTGKQMSKKIDIKKIDSAMGFEEKSFDGMDWYSVDDKPFELNGLYWRKRGGVFRRLPQSVKISVGVDELAWKTAGVMLRFKTDASEIRVNASLWHNSRMDHMASVGSMGFDLYVGSNTNKTYYRSARFDHTKNEYNVTVFKDEKVKKIREFTLHFPLYSGVEKFAIGLSEGAKVYPPSPWIDDRPIVVYGTSIQQGGCASRPGMCHTNILSRKLNRPFINLAFSGSGKGEPEMAETLAKIKNPAMFILDYDANAGVGGLRKTLSGFVDILRSKHPETPILLISRLPQAYEFHGEDEYIEERLNLTSIHLAEIKRRRDMGDKNIHFLDGMTLFGAEPAECTVDGCHATDLGFYFVAQNTAPVIERILNK